MVGVPVIINHKDLTEKNADDERVGVVNSVWFDEKDGWYWCDGVIWDKTAQNLITDKNWSVSCSYDVKTANDEGGSENNIKYDMEFLDGVFTHLALVSNPRYERANIVFNSKTVIQNADKEFVTVGEGENKHAIPIEYLKDNQPKQYGGLSEEQWNKDNEEYRKISKSDTILTPEQVKFVDKHLKSALEDAKFSSQSKDFNEPTREYYKKQVGKIEQQIERLKDWFDLSKHQEKHFNNVWKKYLKEHPEEFVSNERGEWVKDDALIQQKKDNLIPIEIKGDEIPQFETKKDLANWVKGIFSDLGSVNILDTNTEVILTGSSANRETQKHRSTREENKAVFHKFQDMVEKSIKTDERPADERHIHDQDLYFNKMQIDGTPYDVELVFDYLQKNNEFRYAGHKIINSIKIAPSPTQALNALQTAGANNSINDLTINFNPNVKENEDMNVENNKETEMALLEELKKLITKVENDKGDDMDDKEKIENEKVDKRKLIDEVGGILKGKVDDEIIRTIIGKLEKVAYDESEAGKADNEKDEEKEVECCKKAKNADDEKEVKEVEEEVEEDVENCGKKAKVKNSKEDYFSKLNEIYNSCAKAKSQTSYVSRADREKAAEEYFTK